VNKKRWAREIRLEPENEFGNLFVYQLEK